VSTAVTEGPDGSDALKDAAAERAYAAIKTLLDAKDAEIAALKAELKLDSEAWAELHTLRLAVQGPDGFATWQAAAVAERVRRVKAEAGIAALREALGKISRWELPEAVGRDGQPCSYTLEYGSNGARAYIRAIADAAITQVVQA
ncbi:MAG: hypothetical protein JWR74_2009, partial [Polaromonas sp.]|nr:hypothetical protein [Polaromonas sp.]